MARFSISEIPRPKTFLRYMSLRTGAELITMTILVNKISGFYGILALFTGYYLSPLQLSMYIYSILAFGLTLYLAPHIRRQSPLQCLALAWFYAADSLINAAYTAAFGVAWFLVLASQPLDGPGKGVKQPSAGTIYTPAGVSGPGHNASRVGAVAVAKEGLSAGQDAVAIGLANASQGQPAGLGNAIFQSGSVMSITLISGMWLLRVYFVFVMMAYARVVLRQYIAQSSASNYLQFYSTSVSGLADNPFAEDREEGQGWKGKLGRLLLSVGPNYWLGADPDEDNAWMRNVGGKFRKTVEPAGVHERERRRRSGTGPPPPPDMPRLGIVIPK